MVAQPFAQPTGFISMNKYFKNPLYKKITNIIYWIVLAILVIVGALSLMSSRGIPKNFRILVVRSGSMEPAIKTGSLVFVRPSEEYNVGDIITFNKINTKEPVTHRIKQIEEVDSTKIYTTKGDANNTLDLDKILGGQIIGKVFSHISYLGYVIAFTRTTPGFIILIIIPALLIIYDEINNIKKELRLRKEGKKVT